MVDADAHVNEDLQAWSDLDLAYPGWLQAARSGGRWVAQIEGKLFPKQEGPGCGVPIDSATNPSAEAGATDLHQRLRDMDAEGIDVQVLYGGLIIGLTSLDDAGFALALAQAYNDWLLGTVCADASGRLRGVATVPLQDVERAVDEVERVRALGAVAITIPPVLGATTLDDASLLPFFAACAEADLAVAVHSAPGMNVALPGAGLFESYAQVHCLSFPVDQMVALTALAMGGVLDRFPRLRIALLESGVGWVPYFVHRMHEHLDKRSELVPLMRSDPRELFARGQVFVSFEAEEPMLETCVEHLGDGWLVYASDYPHWDSDFPGTVDEVRRLSAGLGEHTTAKLLGDNARRLYALG
ncbi:MAG: amidohydrolase family protein [Acidimicrobiales bacterium]